MPTINALQDELKARVNTVSEIASKGFKIYSTRELEQLSDFVTLPMVGVVYNGTQKQENSVESASGTARVGSSAIYVTAYFTIILAINYKYGGDNDTKIDALELLDDLRAAILGFKGVNSRPWKFNGERPLGSETEGVIFYGQTWETSFPLLGAN